MRDGSLVFGAGRPLAIAPASTTLVVGPNGSGKSTLLALCAGRLHPSTGSVAFFGQPLGQCDLRVVRRRLGYLSSAVSTVLRPSLAVRDVVRTGRRDAWEPWWHVYDQSDDDATAAALDRVGLVGYDNRVYGTLSDGEKRRVELARALVNDPDLLLLDEPTAGLDATARVDTVELLESLDVARVVVVHRLEDAPESRDAIVLSSGRVVAAGPMESTLTGEHLSVAYGRQVFVERRRDASLSMIVARQSANSTR